MQTAALHLQSSHRQVLLHPLLRAYASSSVEDLSDVSLAFPCRRALLRILQPPMQEMRVVLHRCRPQRRRRICPPGGSQCRICRSHRPAPPSGECSAWQRNESLASPYPHAYSAPAAPSNWPVCAQHSHNPSHYTLFNPPIDQVRCTSTITAFLIPLWTGISSSSLRTVPALLRHALHSLYTWRGLGRWTLHNRPCAH